MPSLLADSPGCPISIGKTYQWEEKSGSLQKAVQSNVCKVMGGEKKHTSPQRHESKQHGVHASPTTPSFLFLLTAEKLPLRFQRSKQNFKNCESFSKNEKNKQTRTKKTNHGPENYPVGTQFIFREEVFSKRETTTTKYSVKGETGLVASAL